MLPRIAASLLVVVITASCSGPGRPPTAAPPSATPATSAAAAAPPGVDACSLVTAEELTSILGKSMAAGSPEGFTDRCLWPESGEVLPILSIGFEPGDLDSARAGLANPSDVTVGGEPAVVGALFMEGDILYVARGGTRLWVNLPYVPQDTAEVRQQLTQIAEIAVGRWP